LQVTDEATVTNGELFTSLLFESVNAIANLSPDESASACVVSLQVSMFELETVKLQSIDDGTLFTMT